MTMRVWRGLVRASLGCVAIVGLGMTGQAQPPDPPDPRVEQLLALPISPGAIARLVEHPFDPRVQKRLTAALADPNPSVRTVAARVVFVTASKGQISALVRGLAAEKEAVVAAEQLRALVTFLGAPVDEQGMAAVKRFGSPVADTMAEVVARRSAADLLRLLPELRQIRSRRTTYAEALAIASVQHPESANEIAALVVAKQGEPWMWNIYLTTLRENAALVDEAALLEGLASESAAIRMMSVWHVALAVLDGDGFGDEVLKAAARKAYDAASKELTWEDFGRELLARVQGQPASAAEWARLVGDPTVGGKHGVPVMVYSYLTRPEVKALGIIREDKDAAQLKRIMRTGRRELKEMRARSTTMRTFYGFAPGLLADLRVVSGCKSTAAGAFVGGELTYRPDGRPKSIQLVESRLSKDCEQAGRTAMLLSVAANDQPVEERLHDQIIVLFDRDFVACVDGPHVVPQVWTADNTYRPATVTKQVAYEMPDAARRLHLNGVVSVSALVSHTGCVSYVETRRSLHPLFDLAVIYAMKDWRYSPATVNGTPVEGPAGVSFEVLNH